MAAKVYFEDKGNKENTSAPQLTPCFLGGATPMNGTHKLLSILLFTTISGLTEAYVHDRFFPLMKLSPLF